MKKLSTLTVIAALAVAGTAQLKAAQTNLVQTIGITVTAYTEGDTVTNGTVVSTPVIKTKKATKDIILLLGDAMSVTFSAKAKLLLVTPLPDGDSTVVVQDGTNRTDVSGFFNTDEVGSGVTSSQVNTLTGIQKATEYRIFEFALRNNGGQTVSAHFAVAGLATIKSSSLGKAGAVIGKSHAVSAALAGTGDFKDGLVTKEMVVQVSLVTAGNTLEIVP